MALLARQMPNCIKGALKRSQDLGWNVPGSSNVRRQLETERIVNVIAAQNRG